MVMGGLLVRDIFRCQIVVLAECIDSLTDNTVKVRASTTSYCRTFSWYDVRFVDSLQFPLMQVDQILSIKLIFPELIILALSSKASY